MAWQSIPMVWRTSLSTVFLLAVFPATGLAAPSNNVVLAPVVVTGTRTAKPQNLSPVRTDVISHQELERSHALTLKDALENVPGVQLSQIHGKSGYKISMQGMSSDQVLVLIDGLPISPSTSSTTDLSQYSLATVDHIEVVKGATSAQYGSAAMGGVINVITRPVAPGVTFSGGISGGSYGDQNISGSSADFGKRHGKLRIEGGNKIWRARLNADVLHNDGFAVHPEEWKRQGDDVDRQQYGARLEWHPSEHGEVWLDTSLYREQSTSRYALYVPPNYLPLIVTEEVERNRYTAGGNWHWRNGTKLRVSGVHEQYESLDIKHNKGASFDHRKARLHLTHLNAQLDLPYWHHQIWSIGTDYHLENLRQTEDGKSELKGGKVERNSQEFYLQNDVLFNAQWELLLGARWQYDSDFGAHAVPKISLRYKMPQQKDYSLTLRASFGQGYRVPNLKERHFEFDHSSLGYKVIGNPNIQPEQSNSWQLGADLRWQKQLSAHLNLFRNKVTDLIQVDEANAAVIHGITYFSYRNINKAVTQGAEASVKWQITSALEASLAYTYTESENLRTGEALTRRPKHIGRFDVDWALPTNTTLSLRGRYQSDALVSTATGARTPDWVRVDIKANQQLSPKLDAYIGIDNVFNQQRDFQNPDDFSPITGRFVYLGLNFHWSTNSSAH